MHVRFLPLVFLIAFATSCNPSFRKLHRESIVIDTHNDVLSEVVLGGMNVNNDLTGLAHSDLARWAKGGLDIQVFSVFCNERFGKDTAFRHANVIMDSLMQII